MTGLELLALVGIVDPPRPTARASIATAKAAGIRIRMITGDYAVTAAATARELGIDGTVISGAEFGAMSDEEALAKVDGIGVIARVSPQHKVRLVDVLRKQGQIVAMTGDGVNDAPAVKKADIGIAMGITGTEVTKEAAVMILTDDNFSTIVRAVELGRGLYDNLARYIRYQIGGLFGYIITFLGASIFNIAAGEPLLPLQTLWVSFTTLSIQSVGLGYSKPAAGLMERPPLPPARPILTRGLLVWLAFVGLLMAIGTLGVISWADHAHGLAIARTMGMVTFALFLLFFSIESEGRTGLGVLPRYLLRQDVRHHDQRVLRPAGPVHRPGHLPDRDEDRQARRPAVADLHRRGPVDRGGRRDPQSDAAAHRRDVIQPVGARPAGGTADDVLNGLSRGGKVAQGKMPVPGMGWSAYVLDSEGNTIGLFHQHTSAAAGQA